MVVRLLLAFLLSPAALCAQDVGVGVRVREWLARYDGTIAADGTSNTGPRLDAGSDLGMDDREFGHEIQLSVDIPSVGRFQAGYWRLRLSGDAVLDADTAFDGLLFPAATAVHSSLGFDVFYLDHAYPLLEDPLQVGLLTGIRYLSGETDLKGGGLHAHANLNRPLVLPGVQVGATLMPWLRADTRVEGLAFTAHNVKARYLEWDAEVTALPGPRFSITLGWRLVVTSFKARKESLNFDLDGTIGGPFLALAVRF
jgi:hypothetical protein